MSYTSTSNRTEILSFLKTADYAVNEHDGGTEIGFESSSAVTCSLPAVGDVGNGFTVLVRNAGSGTLTITPNGSETIDGQSSAALSQDEWRWIRSDGTAWDSVAESAGGTNTDELVKVSANDTTAGYLEAKLLAGTGLLASTQNDGANETRTLAVDVGTDANDIVQLDGSARLPAVDGSQLTGGVLFNDVTDNLEVGFTTDLYSIGNSGSGNVTPVLANGSLQTLTVTGSFTLLAPSDSTSGRAVIEATNDGTGGYSPDFSAYASIGGSYDDTANAINLIEITKIGANLYISLTQTV